MSDILDQISLQYIRIAPVGADPSNPAAGESGWGSDGRFVAGAAAQEAFQGALQPVTQKDLRALREGLRTEDLIKIYTETTLRTVSQHEGERPDLLLFDGKTYTVVRTQVHGPENQIPHTKIWATRQTENLVAGSTQAGDPENLVQSIREIFVTVNGLSNAQCIVADHNAPRPPVPYVDVRCDSWGTDNLLGTPVQDWTCNDVDPTLIDDTVKSVKSAFVSLQGYGDLAPQWMSEATMRHTLDAVVAALAARGVSVVDVSPVTNISTVLGSNSERRWLQTWELQYSTQSAVIQVAALETISIDATLESTTGLPALTIDPSDPLAPCENTP